MKPPGATGAGRGRRSDDRGGGARTEAGRRDGAGRSRRPIRRPSRHGRRLLPSSGPPRATVEALLATVRRAARRRPAADGRPARQRTTPTGTEGTPTRGTAARPRPGTPWPSSATSSSAPIVTGLARRLKRALQDSQNDLLDKLRCQGHHLVGRTCCRTRPSTSTRWPPRRCRSWRRPPTPGPPSSASTRRPSADALLGVAHELAESIVGPLRRRLRRVDGLEAAEESVVTEHVGSAFREWKGERIERLAGDHVVAAFSLGTLAAVGAASAGLEWVAVAGPGESPVPGLRGQRAERRPGRRARSSPPGTAIPRPTRAVDACSLLGTP